MKVRWFPLIFSLLLLCFQPQSNAQTAETQPEILMSTNSFGNGWEIFALNPDTGELTNLTNHPADD